MDEEDVVSFKPSFISFGGIETEPLDVRITPASICILIKDPDETSKSLPIELEMKQISKCICHLETNPILMFRPTERIARIIENSIHKTGSIDPRTDRWLLIRRKKEFSNPTKAKLHEILKWYCADEVSCNVINQFIKCAKKDEEKKKTALQKVANPDNSESTGLKILSYPLTGRGAISINTNDYKCLAAEEYLNDVIIDFYLKYLHREVASEQQRQKTFIFSPIFFTALNIPLRERGTVITRQSAAQKHYKRVRNWTKDVNIFDKDFIFVPINRNDHWFLAIICFPSMAISVPSELNSNRGINRRSLRNSNANAAKRPCILTFDSMSGRHTREITTLRDYLNCEFEAKMNVNDGCTFDSSKITGASVRVPKQNNMYDCGLYLLQYVEQFFKDPIRDFDPPIDLKNWFQTSAVTEKRKEIADLIKLKMTAENIFPIKNLPKIRFN